MAFDSVLRGTQPLTVSHTCATLVSSSTGTATADAALHHCPPEAGSATREMLTKSSWPSTHPAAAAPVDAVAVVAAAMAALVLRRRHVCGLHGGRSWRWGCCIRVPAASRLQQDIFQHFIGVTIHNDHPPTETVRNKSESWPTE